MSSIKSSPKQTKYYFQMKLSQFWISSLRTFNSTSDNVEVIKKGENGKMKPYFSSSGILL